jgi:hypothetical protein
MRFRLASAVVFAGVALGVALGGTARTGAYAQDEATAGSPAATSGGQARIADATAKLEDAFAEQFVRGAIDRGALASAIDEAVQAFPEAAREKVQAHIEELIEDGQAAAPQLTAEERAEAVAPPERLGATEQAMIDGWGWRQGRGFGGYGAFGFPGMFSYGHRAHRHAYRHSARLCGWGGGRWCGFGGTGWYW